MTLDDTKKFLMMVNAFFPAMKVENPMETARAWAWALGEFSPKSVEAALQVYIRTNKTGFAPSVSQIIDCIYSLEQDDKPSEGEAWMLVKKALSDSVYNAQERFDELPPLVKEAVGNPSILRQWGQTDSDSVNTVIMSNFQRAYREVVKRQDFKDKVAPQISKLLEETGVKQIGGE